MKEVGGKPGLLVGLDLPSVDGGSEAGVRSHIGALLWVRGETFKAERERADLWQPKWNEKPTVLAAAIYTPDRNAGPLEGTVAGSWSLGTVEQSQGEGCCWLWRDRLKGYEGGDCGGKCLWRKARQPRKQGDMAESRGGGGAVTIASLSPQACTGSWTIARLPHQVPDTLSYRLGPHPGWPFKCLTCRSTNRTQDEVGGGSMFLIQGATEKDPRQMSPLSAWSWGSYGERLAKEAFWSPATRGLKKDSDRTITPVADAVRVLALLALPRSPEAKQLYHFHAQLSLGQNCHRW